VYTSVRDLVPQRNAGTRGGSARRAANSTVILLGLTSLFTDVSSEMVAAILPIYTTVQLGLSPFAYGLVDGLYQGATAFARLGAGHISDRSRRPKAVAAAGYALSMACKLAMLPVNGLLALTAVVAADRAGKGIRTGPRDAMIAGSAPAGSLGLSFGIHRALDTLGAMGGPLLAFYLLTTLPGAYDAVFVTSFCFALLGVAIIVLLVREPSRVVPAEVAPTEVAPTEAPAPAAPAAVPRFRDSLFLLKDREILRVCVVAGLLALLTVSDGFLYLSLERREAIPARLFPLLFLGTSVGYLLLAVPVGHLADRLGRTRVFLAGHVVLLACYLLVLSPWSGPGVVVGTLLLLGSYYAATDGVLSALTSRLVPDELRATGLSLVQTVVAIGKFASALVFGGLWALTGRVDALDVFAVALVAGLALATLTLRKTGQRA
jgi:MFS family permease